MSVEQKNTSEVFLSNSAANPLAVVKGITSNIGATSPTVGAFIASLGEEESTPLAAQRSAAVELGERRIVETLISTRVNHAPLQHQSAGLNHGYYRPGLPSQLPGNEQSMRSLSATRTSSSTVSSPDDDSSYEATEPKMTELVCDLGRYVGQVDLLTGLPHGHGSLHYNNGDTFTGEWREGISHGFGERRYGSRGDVYRGNWRNGMRSGRGAYLFSEGHFYDGTYAEDEPEGYGIFTTLQGDRYTGWWKAGKKHGKGREILVNGQVFVGNWRHGKRQGRGRLYIPNSKEYVYGVWHNGCLFRELTESEAGMEDAEVTGDVVPAPCVSPAAAPPAEQRRSLSAEGDIGVWIQCKTPLEAGLESLGKGMVEEMSDTTGIDNKHENTTCRFSYCDPQGC